MHICAALDWLATWTRSRVGRRLGLLLSTTLLVMYGLLALSPLRWDPPRRVVNGARLTGSGLAFPEAGVAQLQSIRWLDEAIERRQLIVRLRIRSYQPRQEGPARIYTISADHKNRNLTIAQSGADLVIRLRRPGSDHNGKPAFTVENVFRNSDWHTVQLIIADRHVTLKVDDQQRLSQQYATSPLSTWSRWFSAAMGNEVIGARPWLGEIGEAMVLVGDDTYNQLHPARLALPPHYRTNLRVRPLAALPPVDLHNIFFRDALLNYLCFIPCGFLLAISQPRRSAWLLALLICSMMSGMVEYFQLFVAERTSSPLDWLLNTAGAGTGALLGCVLLLCGQHRSAELRSDAHRSAIPRSHRFC